MLSLGYSTCPNDTFIFDAWVNNRLNALEIHPEIHLADIDVLNNQAVKGQLDITKLSFGIIADVSEEYQILDSGSALGFGCGPLLISKKNISPIASSLSELVVAIPGEKTTANLLLSMAFPEIKNKVVMLFSEIEDAVLNGEVDAGLIIHENRFTYQALGLHKIIDLGEHWEKTTGMPIPLGCIAIKRNLPNEYKLQIEKIISDSVKSAFKNPDDSKEYVAKYAQSMNHDVMQQHINLYVNEFSVSLGKTGKAAINRLLSEGQKAGIISTITQPLFLEESD
jgi:1,4-dihydroxy-6-naphthoate synthase